jgi:hypothetical protein
LLFVSSLQKTPSFVVFSKLAQRKCEIAIQKNITVDNVSFVYKTADDRQVGYRDEDDRDNNSGGIGGAIGW